MSVFHDGQLDCQGHAVGCHQIQVEQNGKEVKNKNKLN